MGGDGVDRPLPRLASNPDIGQTARLPDVDGSHHTGQQARSLIRQERLAGGRGLEPRLTESESVVLPLNYPPIRDDFAALSAASAAERRGRPGWWPAYSVALPGDQQGRCKKFARPRPPPGAAFPERADPAARGHFSTGGPPPLPLLPDPGRLGAGGPESDPPARFRPGNHRNARPGAPLGPAKSVEPSFDGEIRTAKDSHRARQALEFHPNRCIQGTPPFGAHRPCRRSPHGLV